MTKVKSLKFRVFQKKALIFLTKYNDHNTVSVTTRALRKVGTSFDKNIGTKRGSKISSHSSLDSMNE